MSPDNNAFSQLINLIPGKNNIAVISTDKSGNVSTVKSTITYILPKVTEIVTDRGGTVNSPNGSSVKIPADALFEAEEITIRVVDPDEEPQPEDDKVQLLGVPHEFGPDGMQFRKTVTITLSYTNLHLDPDQDGTANFTAEKLSIYFWDGSSWLLAGVPTVDKTNQTVKVAVNHFTLYDIGVSSDTNTVGRAEKFSAYWTRNPVKETDPGTFVITYPQGETGNGEISLSIYDMAGDLVKTLIPTQRVSEAPTSPQWNGQNAMGTFSGAGLYIYTLFYKSSDGKVSKIIRKPVGLLKD